MDRSRQGRRHPGELTHWEWIYQREKGSGSDRRRRTRRLGARRRARLAWRRMSPCRANRRNDRHAEDERGERPHDGVLPALGHRRSSSQLSVSAKPRPRRGVHHELHRLRARPHPASRRRRHEARTVEPDAPADLLADVVRSDPARLRADMARRRAALSNAPGEIRRHRIGGPVRDRRSRNRATRNRRSGLSRRLRRRDECHSRRAGHRADRARHPGLSRPLVLPRARFPQARRQGG